METEVTQRELKKDDIVTTDSKDALTDSTAHESASAQTGIQLAFGEYLKARKRLANAFRGRESQDREAYVSAAWKYRICEEAVEKAVKAREKAEREALKIYFKTVDQAMLQASEEFRNRMMQALRECRHKTEQAWQASIEISTDMTYLFQHDVSIPASEGQPEEQAKKKVKNRNNFRKKLIGWKIKFISLFHRETKTPVYQEK